MSIIRVPADKYNGSHRTSTLVTTLEKLESVFGKAHYHSDSDFPDDDYKCSVCMGFKNPKTNKSLGVWSYKMWHYNDEPINHKEIAEFSVYHESEDDLKTLIDMISDKN